LIRAAAFAAAAVIAIPVVSQGQPNEIQLVDLEDHVRRIATRASVSVVTVVSIHRFPEIPETSGQAHAEPSPSMQEEGSRLEATVGSGIVIDPDGYVITSLSVVGVGGEYQISTSDGQVWDAALAGCDYASNLCLLKSGARNLRPLRFGNSTETGPGSMVIIVGRAYGNVPTVSFGALNDRHPWRRAGGMELISTSAPVYPGNCGGALVNLKGELLGVVSGTLGGYDSEEAGSVMRIPPEAEHIATQTQEAQVSFAIPVEELRGAVERLKASKDERSVYFGVRVASWPSERVDEGVVLSGVVPMSPADDAGLRGGDVIASYGGEPVRSPDELLDLVRKSKQGSTVEIEFRRNGDRMKASVALAGIHPYELKLIDKRMARTSGRR
jgi:S1-C subfamily serine protease